jgi:DNA-binding protein YbaB
MFNKLKQIKDLRSQAKTLQNTLSAEKITVEKRGVKMVINGNLEVVELNITDKNQDGLENAIKDCFNDGVKQVQKIMAKKMQEMGGMPDFNSLLKN